VRARIAFLLALFVTSPAAAEPEVDLDGRVRAITDAITDDALAESPSRTALLRPPGADYASLPDQSVAGVAARNGRLDRWLAELDAIDPAKLDDPVMRLAYTFARSRLEDGQRLRACRPELWRVSQMGNAWLVEFADAALVQPIETPELRKAALARAAALPRYVDDQIAALETGLAAGYSSPRLVVDLVISQLDRLIASTDADLPFASPAIRSSDAGFRAEYLALVAHDTRPALARYRAYLVEKYAPRARTSIAVGAQPDGAACYRAALRWSTTLDIAPEEVHARGLAALAEVESQMQRIAARSFGGKPLPDLLVQLRSDPQYLYKDKEQVLQIAQQALDRAWAALPKAFAKLPRARAVLEPIPAFQERTAAAHYLQAALDGSRPGAYRVRLYAPTQQSWISGESTAFHEVVPGHHLQIALANENEALPKMLRLMFTSGFSEGWGLYAEQLSDELGLYSSDAARLGMLNARAWRAVRMVVDSGMHALGWDRKRAVDFLLAHTALSEDQAGQEIDRYIAWPGQAPSYLLGYQEIVGLRREAVRALGPRFDLRAFHEAVLGSGSSTLPMLRDRVRAWLATQ
jgi:uncharacterized protein (DUF885 family)